MNDTEPPALSASGTPERLLLRTALSAFDEFTTNSNCPEAGRELPEGDVAPFEGELPLGTRVVPLSASTLTWTETAPFPTVPQSQ
jgi:hypothetical protein